MRKLKWLILTVPVMIGISIIINPDVLSLTLDEEYRSSSSPGRVELVPADSDTVIVGVLDLKATNVDEGEVEVISERLRFYIGNQPVFQLIERAEMFRIMEEVGFQQLGTCDDEECLVQVGKILGARKMIAGSIGRVGSTYSLHVRIVDIESSQIEHQVFEDVSDIEELLKNATKAIAEELAGMLTTLVEPIPSVPTENPITPSQPVVTETRGANLWSTIATRLSGRGYLTAGAIVDGKFILIEEVESAGGAFCIVLEYDSVTLRWRQRSVYQNSLGRSNAVTGVIDGKLYIAGGRGGFSVSRRLNIFDSDTDGWSTGASMPMGTSRAAAGVINGKLYVAGGTRLGGGSIGGTSNELITYDPGLNMWATLAAMPTARKDAAAAVIDGKFYVVGGTASGGRILSSLEVYDPSTSTWSIKVSLPTAITDATAGVIGEKMYVIGGQSTSDDYVNLVQIFDPTNESWTTMNNLPTARSGAVILTNDNKLYVIGGRGQSGYPNTMDVYTLVEY